MKRFVKTFVPASEYQEVQQVGSEWIVRLEPVTHEEDGTTECYEIVVNSEPDITELTAELQEWKAYMDGKELDIAKTVKIAALSDYDQSPAVNSFDIVLGGQTLSTWLTPERRADYSLSIESAKKLQMTEVTPVFNGVPVTISVEYAEIALAQVQIYANRCYNTTEVHRAAINALETVDEVEAYDFTTGYPDKLVFNL